MKDYLIKDIDGNKIKEGELFNFDLSFNPNNIFKLKGCLSYNDEDLAYEINVIESIEFVVITYATTHIYISNIKKVK